MPTIKEKLNQPIECEKELELSMLEYSKLRGYKEKSTITHQIQKGLLPSNVSYRKLGSTQTYIFTVKPYTKPKE